MKNTENTPAWTSHLKVHNLQILGEKRSTDKRYNQSYNRWQRSVGMPSKYFDYNRTEV